MSPDEILGIGLQACLASARSGQTVRQARWVTLPRGQSGRSQLLFKGGGSIEGVPLRAKAEPVQ
jgi:hypothetical protein